MTNDNWYKSKKVVNGLSANFMDVIKEHEQNDPKSVLYSKSGKSDRIQVSIDPINHYDCWLLVYQNKSDGVKFAKYCLFNNRESKVYARDLLN